MYEEQGFVLYRESYIALFFTLKMHKQTPLFYRGNVLRVCFSFSAKASLVIAGNSVRNRMNELNGWDGQSAFVVLLSP